MSQPSLEELLAPSVAPALTRGKPDAQFTSQISIGKTSVDLEVRAVAGLVNEGTGLEYLQEEGLNPDEWEATHFRKIKYGEGMESVKFSYKRVAFVTSSVNVDDVLAQIGTQVPSASRDDGDHGYVVALGDMQFGKIDGDGSEGSLERTLRFLHQAREQLEEYRKRYDVGHVHLGWLGDHIEGFVSQGGANVWRTGLTLTDQLKLTRAVMTEGMKLFADSAERVSMTAVPGNHGDTVRFNGKGATRYDDSFDTDSLVAVSEAAKLAPGFQHVEFYVPDTDEMTVVLDVAGTVLGHAHGHKWKKNQHWNWWQGHAFNGHALGQAHVLLAGHLHHFYVDTKGTRMFIQVPSTESESTWFRHATGTIGHPGIVTMITRNGLVGPIEVVR